MRVSKALIINNNISKLGYMKKKMFSMFKHLFDTLNVQENKKVLKKEYVRNNLQELLL